MMLKVLPWVLVIGLLAGAGMLYSKNQKQSVEVGQLRQELEQANASVQEATKVRADSETSELVRLRRENEDLLRLRNEVRQLRDEKAALTKQVQTAVTQSQKETGRAQSQGTAPTIPGPIGLNPTGVAPNVAVPTNAAEAEEFRKRYGLQPGATVDPVNLCLNNLRMIDAAKMQWALEKAKPPNTLVAAPDIAPYVKDHVVPTCPAGGTYTINPVGVAPTCSSPGHVLPK